MIVSTVSFNDAELFLFQGHEQQQKLLQALQKLAVNSINVTNVAKRIHMIPSYEFLSTLQFDTAYAVFDDWVRDSLVDIGLSEILIRDFDIYLESPDDFDEEIIDKSLKIRLRNFII